MFIGVDVSGRTLHCVALNDARRIEKVWLVDVEDIKVLPALFGPAAVVAIDAPSELSTAPHRLDLDPRLSQKFRAGRCAEIALGREHRIWVPWVAPASPPLPSWIETGLRVFKMLATAGQDVIEVYPHAGYRVLATGGPLPKKSTAAGVKTRIELLCQRGIGEPHIAMWSHDGLDALLAALIAHDKASGTALRVTCAHDDSAIWLPAIDS